MQLSSSWPDFEPTYAVIDTDSFVKVPIGSVVTEVHVSDARPSNP